MVQTEAALVIAEELGKYIGRELLGDDSIIDPEQNLLGEEVIDSLGMLRMVGYIELQYGVQISPRDYLIENFRDLRCIGQYVNRLLTQAGE